MSTVAGAQPRDHTCPWLLSHVDAGLGSHDRDWGPQSLKPSLSGPLLRRNGDESVDRAVWRAGRVLVRWFIWREASGADTQPPCGQSLHLLFGLNFIKPELK